jgi:hypothetical protein
VIAGWCPTPRSAPSDGVEIRRVIRSANAIVAQSPLPPRDQARGHFPVEEVALKCLYLLTRSLSPTGVGRARSLRGIDEVVGRYERSNGRSVKGAENFSWSGMSSAVRRLTQGALAPNPHTPVINGTSGHHDHFTCFPSTRLAAGARIPHERYLPDFLMHNNGFIRD